MNLLYNAGIRFYAAGVKLASCRNVKAAKMIAGQRDTVRRLKAALQPGKKYVWVHAASLGEFEQGRPLIEKLHRERPDLGVALTFFSPSGFEVRCNYAGADVVCYLPFDTPGRAKDFLDALNPVMAVFVKYEFWGNYLKELRRRGIPTYLVSSIFRPSQPFFKWWGGMFRGMLRCYTRIFVQDTASAELLSRIGVAENVTVAGDTRFDRVSDILKATVDMPYVEKFVSGSALAFIAGSSWPEDEDVYSPWLKAHPQVRLIVAPHEFDAARLEKLRYAGAGRGVLLSELEKDGAVAAGVSTLVIDCFGKLASLYRYGNVAYIGGGFGEGIHNINEAAVYGIPVMFGPKYSKFKEAKDLMACGGAFSFSSRDEFELVMNKLLRDAEAREKAGKVAGEYIERNLGATDKVFDGIFG